MGARCRLALLIAFGVMFELSTAARLLAAPCVADVQLVATNEMTVPALAGYQLAGYWDVAGDGFGSSTAGNANMGLFYKMADDPSKCLQTLCLKASDKIDPGLPDGYTRVGKWDVDGGGSQAICHRYDGTRSYEFGDFSRGYWMMGMYKRPYSGPGSRVIESIHLTASDSDKVLAPSDHTWVAAWDVDRGGGVGSKDGSKGSYMMTLSVKFVLPPAPPVTQAPAPVDAQPVASAPVVPAPAQRVRRSKTDWYPTVDGRTVTWVSHSEGTFQKINATQWQEFNRSGGPIYLFTEKKSNASTVSLYDASRDLYLDINVSTKLINCCGANPRTNTPLYDITGTNDAFVPMVSALIAVPRNYYRLKLRTSDTYNLRVWNNGRVGADQVKDDYSTWLLVPTGENLDEYWLFNKGAKSGHGQAMARPAALNTLNQWDFIPDDKAQRFKLQFTTNGYFRLIEQSTGKAVSTRWHETAFVWDVNPTDTQQEFRLEQVGWVKPTDTLLGYLYWNVDSDHIKSYFSDYSRLTPPPSAVNIKKMVFMNVSNRTVGPAVHHAGCGGAPWRQNMPQCWYSSLAPNQKGELEVSDYMKNGEQIWAIIGSAAAIAAGIAITVACVGLCGPAVAAALTPTPAALVALGPAATAAGGATAGALISIQLGAALTIATIDIVDFALLSWATERIIYQGLELGEQGGAKVSGVLTDLGVSENNLRIVRENLGEHVFVVRGSKYSALTKGFYVEDTTINDPITRMFYANGTCLFLIE